MLLSLHTEGGARPGADCDAALPEMVVEDRHKLSFASTITFSLQLVEDEANSAHERWLSANSGVDAVGDARVRRAERPLDSSCSPSLELVALLEFQRRMLLTRAPLTESDGGCPWAPECRACI